MPHPTRRLVLGLLASLPLAACSTPSVSTRSAPHDPPLYPNETPELRRLINRYADHYEVPRSLVHRLAIRMRRSAGMRGGIITRPSARGCWSRPGCGLEGLLLPLV